MSWERPILTDSGGVSSLQSELASQDKTKNGLSSFQSHLDGFYSLFVAPEKSMGRFKRRSGSDIVMAFDECTPFPATREERLTRVAGN